MRKFYKFIQKYDYTTYIEKNKAIPPPIYYCFFVFSRLTGNFNDNASIFICDFYVFSGTFVFISGLLVILGTFTLM